MLDGRIVVSHSHFDRVALEEAFDRHEIPRLSCEWLDSTLVARRAWEGFSKRGFGLENLCRILGYRYQRHDALGDAKAAGVVMLAAIEQTGIGLTRWLRQVGTAHRRRAAPAHPGAGRRSRRRGAGAAPRHSPREPPFQPGGSAATGGA